MAAIPGIITGVLMVGGVGVIVVIFLRLLLNRAAGKARSDEVVFAGGGAETARELPRDDIPLRVRALMPRRAAVRLAEQVAGLDWFQFERLTALLYRKNGYAVERRGGAKSDGGLDLVIGMGTEKWGVQCKHWKAWKVGVRNVREFIGALQVDGLSQGYLLSSKGFTAEAQQLAAGHGVKLVGADDFVRMLEGADAGYDLDFRQLFDDRRKMCPRCESEMEVKVAKKGPGAGKEFWGCSRYPRCRYTMRMEDAARPH